MINRESKKKRLNSAWLVAIVLSMVFLASTLAKDEPNDPNALLIDGPNLQAEPYMPGTVEGTGTYFEVTDSNYLNITLESSEPVNLRLESVPEMIVMDVNATNEAASTQITLTGFTPSTTYYKYEDDYHNGAAFTTDGSGSYTYTQDLSAPHLVFIQPGASTIFLSDSGWSDPTVGTWDPGTKTGTLTQDVYETIQIDSDDITLDGAGHTVTGSGFGVYLPSGRTAVTIKDINVRGFGYGIYLYYSSGNTLTANTASNNSFGILLFFSSGNTLTGNTASNNGNGILLYDSSGNTLTGNTASNNPNAHGIYLNWGSNNNTLTRNTTSNNWCGFNLYRSSGNTLTDNTILNNRYGIALTYSNSNHIYNNNFIDNTHRQAIVSPGSGNVFNLDKPIGGNYWSNWTTPDDDGDGFVDSPYIFNVGQDNLPWVVQDDWLNQPPMADAGPDQTVILGQTVTFNASGSYDPDGTIASYDWDFGDYTAGSGEITTHEYSFAGVYTATLTVTDNDAATDTDTAIVTVQTPAEATQDLILYVLIFDLPQGIENSLVSKLEAAIKSLDRGRENAAENQLNAFINQVEAQRGKKISEEDADALIAAAQQIIDLLMAD